MLPSFLHLGGTLTVSLALGLYLTPIIRKGALRFGVLDAPDGRLKRQHEPVPYLGGIAVYLAFLLTLAVIFPLDHHFLGLLLGGTLMAMLGLFDDMKVLPVGAKLWGQLLAALVLIRSDISIQLEILPHWLAVPLTVAWLVGVTNAVNILDVSDGLAAATSIVAALGLCIIAVLGGQLLIATTALALLGSLAGFLWFNRPPARIYLGDAGSLFVGFMLAALTMLGAYTERNTVAALAPLALLIVPLLELTLVSVARVRRGVRPWHGSGDHCALRLKARAWPAARIALAAALLGAVGAGTAIAMVLVSTAWALALVAALVLVGLALLGLVLVRYPAPY